MDTIKAICKCKDMDEGKIVLAIKQKRFAFTEKWGDFIWLNVIILVVVTDCIWIAAIIGWHFSDIVNPKYHCNQCEAEVQRKQFHSEKTIDAANRGA